jgi:hypothetical protein
MTFSFLCCSTFVCGITQDTYDGLNYTASNTIVSYALLQNLASALPAVKVAKEEHIKLFTKQMIIINNF